MPIASADATPRRTRDVLSLLGFGAAFLIAHQLGLRSLTPASPLSPVWPPSGVLLAGFILLPGRLRVPAIAVMVVADTLSHYLAGLRVGVGLLYLLPSLVEAAVALVVVDRFAGRSLDFRRIRHTLALFAAAVTGAAISGLPAALVTVSTNPAATYWHAFFTWFSADSLGTLLVTPLIVAWARGPALRRLQTPQLVEGIVFLLVWTWISREILKGDLWLGPVRAHPYMLGPLMVWASIRLGVRGVSAAMTAVAVVAVDVVLKGAAYLPLVGDSVSEQLFLVQVFLAVMGVTGLLLASALAERRQATDVARETIDQLRALGDNIPAGIVAKLETDPDGHARFVYVSAGIERIMGLSAADVIRDATLVYDCIVEEERERFRAAELESRRVLGDFSFETRIRRPDGEERWLLFSSTSRRLEDGTIVSDGVAVDVTERHQSEDRLRRANRALRTISSCNQVLVKAASEDALLHDVCRVLVSEGGFRLAWVAYAEFDEERRMIPVAHAGFEDHYLEGLDIRWSDTERGRGPTGRAMRTGQLVVNHDFLSDPSVAPWRDEAIARGYRASAVFPLRDANGAPFGTLSVYAPEAGAFDEEECALLTELAEDLAFGIRAVRAREERVRAEAALAASEERFRQLAENIREIFWMNDARTGATLYISPGVERMLGVSAETLVQSPDLGLQLIHPDDRATVISAFERSVAGGDHDVQYRVIRPDGTLRWIHARAFPVRNGDGEVYRVVGVSDDVTDRRRIEEQLRQVQKLEAIGQLAGGIAHDFNNILAAILMQAGTARALPGLPADVAELLQDVEASAQRASNLTRQLLLFSRKSVMREQEVEVNDLVAGLARMLRRVVPETHRLQLSLHPRALAVRADPGMLEQVVLNLTVNARDAMPHGGDLSIETFERDLSADDVQAHPGASPGRFVGIRVRDAGTGIPPAVRRHIFEPFFTTKETGKGTGLGLATAFGIVQQHRGLIVVESEVGRGSTFEVLLPAAPTSAPPPFSDLPTGNGEARPARTSNGGPDTSRDADTNARQHARQQVLLVVEDDTVLRAVLRRVLERAGYRVHLARSGREALQEWEQYDPRPDLLLTDMVMPDGVGGAALATSLLAREPGLKVVYSSGYDPDSSAHGTRLEPGVNFLQKPATPRQILEIVARQLHDD